MKLALDAKHLLIILIIALLGCSMFTCKMIEGLSGRGDGTRTTKDIPVDSSTLEQLPFDPLYGSRPMPSPSAGVPTGLYGFNSTSELVIPSSGDHVSTLNVHNAAAYDAPTTFTGHSTFNGGAGASNFRGREGLTGMTSGDNGGTGSGSGSGGSTAQSALPQGIPYSEIPDGDQDLYIKKSEVVPPVCPVCPSVTAAARDKPCPPCPACARCPEPAFECKKVPSYASGSATGGGSSGGGSDILPRPVLADFSQFGM